MNEPTLPVQGEDLLPIQARSYSLVREMATLISSPDAMRVQWNGHTDYQFRNHILNPADYPGPFAQRRQIYRELHARMEAAIVNRYEYVKAGHEAEGFSIQRLELDRYDWTWKHGSREAKAHAIAGLDLEISMRRARQAQLQFDWETRIMREGRAFVDILSKTPEIEDGTADEAERAMWEQRATRDGAAKGAKR